MTTDRPRIVRRDRSEIINAARAAWRHLKSDDKTDFQYWLKIGEAAPADLSVDALIAALEARVPDLPMREQVAIAEKLAAIVQRIAAAHPAPNRRRSGRRTAPGITIRGLNLNARPTADGEEVDSEEEDDRRPRTRSRKAARAL